MTGRKATGEGSWVWRKGAGGLLLLAGMLLVTQPPASGEDQAAAADATEGSATAATATAEPATSPDAADAPPEPTAADEAFVRSEQSAEAMMKAFDAGDVEALAAMFAADGELIDEAGNVFTGRDEVAGLFAAFFEKFPGAMLAIEVLDARTVGETLAIEEGLRQIVTPDGAAAQLQYTAVRTRDGDDWPIVSYREYADDPPPTPGEMLEPLDFLVGEWVDESPEGRTTIRYDWSPDGNFLVGEYELAIEGRPVGTTSQRIGWDPVEGAVRSWTFDPDGGFSQGEWLPTDDGWLIRSEATMPDGSTGIATVTIRVRDQDHFSVESSDRIVAGVPEPDFTLVIARKPPLPGLGDAAADGEETAAEASDDEKGDDETDDETKDAGTSRSDNASENDGSED